APGGGAPGGPAHAVARPEGPQVAEADPLAAGARHLVAGECLGLERAQEPLQRLAAGIHPERLPQFEPPLTDEQPEHLRRAEHEVADDVPAPARAAEREVELAPLSPVQP